MALNGLGEWSSAVSGLTSFHSSLWNYSGGARPHSLNLDQASIDSMGSMFIAKIDFDVTR